MKTLTANVSGVLQADAATPSFKLLPGRRYVFQWANPNTLSAGTITPRQDDDNGQPVPFPVSTASGDGTISYSLADGDASGGFEFTATEVVFAIASAGFTEGDEVLVSLTLIEG